MGLGRFFESQALSVISLLERVRLPDSLRKKIIVLFLPRLSHYPLVLSTSVVTVREYRVSPPEMARYFRAELELYRTETFVWKFSTFITSN